MVIKKNPAKKTKTPTATATNEAAVDAFLDGAPDAAATPSPNASKGKKVPITLTISEPLLRRIDKMAENLGHSRSGVITLAANLLLDSDLNTKGA